MRAVSLPPPILVADEDSLGGLVRALAPYPVVGVDTESNSFHAYRERVCLIQFSTPAVDYIVDPISLPDLKTLAPFFAKSEPAEGLPTLPSMISSASAATTTSSLRTSSIR